MHATRDERAGTRERLVIALLYSDGPFDLSLSTASAPATAAFRAFLERASLRYVWHVRAMLQTVDHGRVTAHASTGSSDCEEAAIDAEDKMTNDTMTVHFSPNDKASPLGKPADAEIHFTAGPLEGLKLIGFSVWERRTGAGRNVTFPACQCSVNGERRSFALLRPIADAIAQNRIRDIILNAYSQLEEQLAQRA